MDCKRKISIADRSFHGNCLTPQAKRKLPEFVIDHIDCKVKLISEYDEERTDYNDT
jgi:hypothetical protein